jgi:adenylylsulfate kinase-like enzyme/beta-phosphoglucomutase-like phosphatase (HAD superfamily)
MPQLALSHELLQDRPVIVVDIDGVLFNTPQQAVERWNNDYGTDYAVQDIFDFNAKHDKELFRHWHDEGTETDKETGKNFDDGFYSAQKDVANYLLIPGARGVLARLKREYGASLHALTARDKNNLGDVTLAALEEHFGVGEADEHVIDELHFSGDPDFIGEAQADKGTILRDKLGAHIMVEDSIANAQSSRKANVATFVLSQTYNQEGHDWSADAIAQDWDALYNLIADSLEAQGFKKISEQGGGMSLVLILRGPSGVGKSTISRHIQENLGVNWVVIDVDKFKHYIHLEDSEDSRIKGSQGRKERSTIAHNVSHFFAKQVYDKGYSVILEEMYRQEHIANLKEYLDENGMRFITVFLAASVEDVVTRSAGREKRVPEEETRNFYEEVVPYEGDIIIDTSKYSSSESAQLIINEVRNFNL